MKTTYKLEVEHIDGMVKFDLSRRRLNTGRYAPVVSGLADDMTAVLKSCDYQIASIESKETN